MIINNKFNSIIVCLTLFTFIIKAQQFVNGDLEGGTPGISVLPPNWQSVPYDDVNCIATSVGDATPDLTGIDDISANGGLMGTPYSGSTFVSGLVGETFQEGIMQAVSGLEVGKTYTISFYQSVVKQDNALDKSGSWAVYFDIILASITQPTHSEAAYNSISFIWEARNIVFTATSTSHLIKFLPVDNDTNGTFSLSDTTGALRMGIDAISLSLANGIKENETKDECLNIFPNPFKKYFFVDLSQFPTSDLIIYDDNGKKIYEDKSKTGIVKIDYENLDSGMYFIQVINEKNNITCKIIKE